MVTFPSFCHAAQSILQGMPRQLQRGKADKYGRSGKPVAKRQGEQVWPQWQICFLWSVVCACRPRAVSIFLSRANALYHTAGIRHSIAVSLLQTCKVNKYGRSG